MPRVFDNTGLAAATAGRFALALTKSAKAPDWVMLMPAGRVETNDGRWFDNTRPDDVVLAFTNGNLHLPFDFEHASEIKSPMGEYAPAAGWIAELANRDGEIWGRVEWTERGRTAIEAREVKYVSPAFNYDYDTKVVTNLTSAALTVRPAIASLPALTSQQPKDKTHMEKKALCALLGLAETATETEIAAAITSNKAKALASATPSLEHFVPRADYDTALGRATTAEAALASREAATVKAEAQALVDEGVKDGKIAPASKDFYLGMCANKEGLDKFKAFLTSAPKIVATAAKGDDDKPGEGKALTSQQKQVARMMGLTDEQMVEQIALDKKEAA